MHRVVPDHRHAGGTLVSNGSAVYLGQKASGPGITVTRADGGPFRLYEFDAEGLHVAPAASSPDAQRVSLVGLRVGGDVLGAADELHGRAPFAHFAVPATWSDLQAVTFTGLLSEATPGALALDDVGVGQGPASVAEPGTLMPGVLTTLGVGAAALARRRRDAFRPPVAPSSLGLQVKGSPGGGS